MFLKRAIALVYIEQHLAKMARRGHSFARRPSLRWEPDGTGRARRAPGAWRLSAVATCTIARRRGSRRKNPALALGVVALLGAAGAE